MIYKLNDKYYVKVSGYLIEVIPFLNEKVLDFKTTQNKIEITANLQYKAVSIDVIKNELENPKKNKPELSDEFDMDLKSKKVSERTHNKYKFNKD